MRLRTAHDSTIRDLVISSWDDTDQPTRRHTLPPRSATDVSGAALHAARLAEAAAREAADASAAAKAAAAYAKRLADAETCDRAAPCDRGGARVDTSVLRSCTSDVSQIKEERRRLQPAKVRSRLSERLRRGVVRPVPLGKVWSFDVVALWHNAVRIDLADLEDILAGLLEAQRAITLPELRALFAWFSTFEAFVVTCLKAEEEVLFPWLEQWGRIDGDLSTASRITTKGTIIRGIRDTAACAAHAGLDRDRGGMVLTNPDRNYYDGLKVGFVELAPNVQVCDTSHLYCNVLQKVAGHVSAFASSLLDYFHEQEKSLPPIIDSLYDMQDMYSASIERRMLRSLWKCGRKDESMVMLLRAVEEAPFPRVWISRNLRVVERFTIPIWKRRYNQGRGAVTAKFKERKVGWMRAAATLNPDDYATDDEGGDRSSGNHGSSANLSANIYPVSHAPSFNTVSSLEMRFPRGHNT